MAKNFSILRAKMSPESRARSEALAAEMLAVMDLAELRRAQDLSQGELAERLDKGQPAVAKVESRQDPHVSTIREYVEALGGRLDLVAHMPNNETILLKSLSSKSE
ncbi:MAG: helix-turn-helix transcriptional regulator [Deltaproteobacteria bacterium]|jgi:transcriptional regulator with XRE-family HTH domain|nr:helix-turn-helix transcriptional regulator [Deltaproteobacteria bacterium]